MKVNGPLFSTEARGSVTDSLTFSKRTSGQQVRFQRKQKDVITTGRTTQRSKFSAAILRWKTRDFGVDEFGLSFFGMDTADFERIATLYYITGYNYFLQDYLLNGE